MNPEGADLLQTGLRERDEAENEPLLDSDNDDSDEAVERPAITHSGRANNTIAINMPSVLATSVHKHGAAILEITRRSEIDFSIFDSSTNSEWAGTFLFWWFYIVYN